MRDVTRALLLSGFSPRLYRRGYADLDQALADDNAGMWHFIAYCEEFTRPFAVDLNLTGLRRLFESRAPKHFKASVAVAMLNTACSAAAPLWSAPADVQTAFWSELLAILRMAGTPFFIIGDSHSYLYRRVADSARGTLIPIPVLCTASSAVGLANPHSQSGAGARLLRLAAALEAIGETQIPLLFKFGQVDVEFVFNFERIERRQYDFEPEEFEQFCRKSVDSYLGFLSRHFRRPSVTVIGIFPPALSDDAWRDGYVNAHVAEVQSRQSLHQVAAGVRDLQIPRLRERTRMHGRYNDFLRARAAADTLRFFDDLPHFLGADGVVDPRFTPTHKGADHHLEERATATTIKVLLTEHLLVGL